MKIKAYAVCTGWRNNVSFYPFTAEGRPLPYSIFAQKQEAQNLVYVLGKRNAAPEWSPRVVSINIEINELYWKVRVQPEGGMIETRVALKTYYRTQHDVIKYYQMRGFTIWEVSDPEPE